MKVTASVKQARISTRKVRLVADAVRRMSVEQALLQLPLVRKRAATLLADVMNSAVANAINNAKLSRQDLVISEIIVNEGQSLKRYHASTRGRIHPYKKRSTNITVILEDKPKVVAVAPKKAVEKGGSK